MKNKLSSMNYHSRKSKNCSKHPKLQGQAHRNRRALQESHILALKSYSNLLSMPQINVELKHLAHKHFSLALDTGKRIYGDKQDSFDEEINESSYF